jgi:hypothetical protein
MPGRTKKIVNYFTEGALAILLVLLCFGSFMYLLNAMFPTGTSLKSLITRQDGFDDDGSGAGGKRRLRLDGGEGDMADPSLRGDLAAILSMARNTVKSKSADGIAWNSASVGHLLYDRDAVQTQKRSSAIITFDENARLDMGENSLVIIKRLTQDPVHREKRSFMVLVDGDLRGQMAKEAADSVYLEIDTAAGAKVSTMGGAKAAGPVDFKVTVNPDKSSTISVYSGQAVVSAQGKTVKIGANQATVVALDGAPLDPRRIPDAVSLKRPGDKGFFTYRDLSPKVRFIWDDHKAADRYHFVLARDIEFKDVVTDEHLEQPKFTHGNLKYGTYYWKVSAIDHTTEGHFSTVRRLSVKQDNKPPVLKVTFPPKTMYGGRYTLRGKTEPGARVFVGGQRIKTTRDGRFKYNLMLKPGINVIVVEAFDSVNNMAYQSQSVNRKG